jgi:predicted Zn-dependent protease
VTVVYLVPLVADRLAPLIPLSLEARLGDAVDGQVRSLFGEHACVAESGKAALNRLASQLTGAASLPLAAEIAVLPSEVANAIALPGGRVYVFEGLLKAAESPDELAGVLAHELGHVAGRDGLRLLLHRSGSAFLLGLLFGDVTGGGVIIFGAQALVDTQYSRAAETAADDFAADLMLDLGRSPLPLGEFLSRIAVDSPNLAFISTHPLTTERMANLEEAHRAATEAPLLSDEEWQALKVICERS